MSAKPRQRDLGPPLPWGAAQLVSSSGRLPWPCKGEGAHVHTAVNLIPQEQTAFPPFPVQSPILPLPVGQLSPS